MQIKRIPAYPSPEQEKEAVKALVEDGCVLLGSVYTVAACATRLEALYQRMGEARCKANYGVLDESSGVISIEKDIVFNRVRIMHDRS
jgi:hypothetical protein